MSNLTWHYALAPNGYSPLDTDSLGLTMSDPKVQTTVVTDRSAVEAYEALLKQGGYFNLKAGPLYRIGLRYQGEQITLVGVAVWFAGAWRMPEDQSVDPKHFKRLIDVARAKGWINQAGLPM